MFWNTKQGKTLILKGYFVFAIITVIIGIAMGIFLPIIRSGPEQHERVEVVGKRSSPTYTRESKFKIPTCYITFKFSDGSEQEYNVSYSDYKSIQENDKGVLSYKPRKNIDSAKPYRGYFVSFEKDP